MKQRALFGVVVLGLLAAFDSQATQFSTVDYRLYAGDFNGDGKSDLLYIGNTPDKPNGIALGDANGVPQLGFQSWPATFLGLPWGTGQFVPVIGDFNGDGKSDVLLQSATPGTSYVLLANTNVSLAPVGQLVGINQGIAATAFGIEWSADKHKLLVGDFDGNGKDDVLLQATNKGGTNAIILSDNAGGLFTASTGNCWASGPQQCWTDGEQGLLWSTQSSVLTIGKFNSDTKSDILIQGRPDFVLIDFDIPIPVPVYRPLSFGIFLAQAPDGAGKIVRTPNQLWNYNGLGANWSPLNTNLVVGDFNGDGYADVLIQGRNSGIPNVLVTGASNGTFGSATSVAGNVAGWTADSYNMIVGRFGGSSAAVLYLQAQTPGGSNYFTSNITQGSVSATLSALQTAAVLPAPATSVGATPATADVTPNGAGSYTIPIQLPKGTAGLTPSLSLTYSSGAGNGLVGVGWNLSGLGIIARCPKTKAQDGVTQPVQLLATDEYCLNGNRLRWVSGNPQGQAGSVYRTELETFARVTAMNNGVQGPESFQVETKDGLIYEYGNALDARIAVTGTSITRVWALSKVRDRAFNNWTVAYTNDTVNGSYRPDRIDYTANSAQSTAAPYRVKFFYENRNPGENVVNYYAGGLVNQTQRLQRVELQSSGGAQMIRKYTLFYSPVVSSFNTLSRLSSVQECSPSFACIAQTTFAWSDLQMSGTDLAFDPTVRAAPHFLDPPASSSIGTRSLDINGDGVLDVVSWGATGGTPFYVSLGAAHGQAPPAGTSVTKNAYGDNAGTIYDWDGDGKEDLLVASNTASYWWLHQKADLTFALDQTTEPMVVAHTAVDVDGDGFRDFVRVVTGPSSSVYVRFHNRVAVVGLEPSETLAWSAPGGTTIPYPWLGVSPWDTRFRSNLSAADVDGDGRQDLLVQVNNGWRVLYSTGTGFVTGDLLVTKFDTSTQSYILPVAIDVNGDGCTDFAYPNNVASPTLHISVSTCRSSGGVGLNAPLNTGLPVTSPAQLGTNVVDWNLDGYQDLVYPGSGGNMVVALSTGTTLVSNTVGAYLSIYSDLDGDAIPDRAYPCGCSSYQYYYNAALGPKPNLLLSAKDGFGNQAAFTYAPLTDSTVYTRGTTGIGKTQDVGAPMYVVKQMAMSDGVGGTYTQTYTYQGALRNIEGRGSLGFAGRTMTESRTGFVTQETYNNSVGNDGSLWERVGTLAQRVVRQSATGPVVSETTQTFDSLLPDGASNRRYPFASQVVTKRYELTGVNSPYATSTTTTLVDNYGTPYDVTTATVEGITGLNSGSSFTQRRYTTTANIVNDATYWCISRPTRIEDIRSHTLADGGSLTRLATQGWDIPNCRVTSTVIEPGSSWALTTTLDYDLFNNVNKTTVSASTITTAVTEANYGANGHLQQWAKNAKGHQSYFGWDVNLGVRTSVTDPNGLITTWTYDDLGRELQMTRPDGTSTYKTYYLCDPSNSYCGDGLLRYGIRTTERDTSPAEINHTDQFFDLMGRVKYEQILGLNGESITVQTLYDNRGNVATKSNPFVVGAGSVSGTSYAYDGLSRVVQTRRPMSDSDRTIITESTSYDGLATTKTDARGYTQKTVKSVFGAVVRATDEAGKDTDYTYNSFGDLRTVKDPPGNITSLTYNVRGFKEGSNDPDLGPWSYTYDALGEALSQTDAKGQKTTFGYDVLGRTTTRVDDALATAQTTTWFWDTGTHGNGLLAKGMLGSVTAPGGYSELYTYDIRSRKSTFTTIANGNAYAMSYAYDTVTGKLRTLTYPPSTGTAFAAQYGYQRGFLKDVRDAANPGTPLWQANAQDPLGHVTQEQFGNGQITNLGFDRTNGRLYSVQTGPGGGAATQNLAYQWDAIGNLQSRSDWTQTVTEAFSYDATNRATAVTRNGTTTMTTGFNDIGNITNKSDVGGYVYDVPQAGCTYYGYPQPHAVRKVGTNVYCYDANGNMVSRSGASVTWSTFNYPTQINQAGGNSSTFYYGADRNRYRQVNVDGGITEDGITVGDGAFEYLTRTGGQIEYRHFVSANGRVVAIVKRSAQTGNKTLYLHADHLGSTDVITDEASVLVIHSSFDAWGQRRGGNWSGQPSPADKAAIGGSTHRGYTGHEQLDNLNLVHMKGRVYDPAIARFTSADPIVQSPYRSQSFNRYSYLWNNPLNATDPTGLCKVTGSLIEYDQCYDGYTSRQTPESFAANGPAGDLPRFRGRVTIDATNNSAQATATGQLPDPRVTNNGASSSSLAGAARHLFGQIIGTAEAQELSDEERALDATIALAKQGHLGFQLPEGWTYSYSPSMVKCMRGPVGGGCFARADVEDPNDPDRAFALTSQSQNHTDFYKGSATADTIGTPFSRPTAPDEVIFTPGRLLDAYEKAAYVIGHEVNGHLNHELSGDARDELISNYYGLLALKEYRSYKESMSDEARQ